MNKDDWFRLRTWSEEDKKNFFNRLNRSSSSFHKAQYLRIQADYLSKEYPESAIELCDIVLNDYPEESELSMTHYTKAKCYLKLKNDKEAIKSFRASIQAMRQYPNSKNYSYLDFGYWVITNKKIELYDEIMDLTFEYQGDMTFPNDYYLLYGIRSIINYHKNNLEQSKLESQKAIENANKIHSGFRYHPNIGLVEEEKKQQIFYKKLLKISTV